MGGGGIPAPPHHQSGLEGKGPHLPQAPEAPPSLPEAQPSQRSHWYFNPHPGNGYSPPRFFLPL